MRRGPRTPIKTRLKTRLKQKQALELATSGLTYAEIARELGYKSKGRVHTLVHDALREVPAEAREAYRLLEDQRIEALMTVYMPLAMGSDEAEPNIDAARFVDTLIGRRAKLVGINEAEQAPVNKDGKTVGDADGFDAVAILASRIARIAGRSGPGGGAGGAEP